MRGVEVLQVNGGRIPTRVTTGAAGFDVYANTNDIVTIYPGETKKIGLGFALNIRDAEVAAMLLPRSGLGASGLILANTVGLIDSDYQGEVIAAMYNRSEQPFNVSPGDRVAQLLFIPIILPHLAIVSRFSEQTERGAGGFGSTGTGVSQ